MAAQTEKRGFELSPFCLPYAAWRRSLPAWVC